MKIFHGVATALVALAAGCGAFAVDGMKLPPLTGELSGEFKPFESADTPKLHWTTKIKAISDPSEGRVIEIEIDGGGTRLRGEINLVTTEQGTWKISDGELDITPWFPPLAVKVGSAMSGLTAKGVISIQGSGLIRAGKPEGTLQVKVRDGRLGKADGSWTLEGVNLAAEFLVETEGMKARSTTPFELTVRRIATNRFGADNLFIVGVLNADRTIAINEAHIGIAGGEVKIDPAMLALSPLALEATLYIASVGLQDIAALVPHSFTSAEGKIDGTVRIGWSLAAGFHVGAGNLALGRTEAAIVRLAPTPGFITQTMPKRFEPVPTWMGPVSKWLSADNPAFTDMAEIELGRAPLEVESLTVKLTPEGDEVGRTATVRMKARPTKPGAAVKVVNIDVNVAGPLDSILKFGLNEDFSAELHK